MSNFLVKQKFMFSKIYILYIMFTYICIYICKSFYTMLDKNLRKNIKTEERDGEIGKHKLNEMWALNMKEKVKQIKQK